MKKVVLFLTVLLLSSPIFAEENTSTIASIQSYPDYGNGDFVFTHTSPKDNGVCRGYWLSPASPGFDTTVSLVIAAFHSGKSVRVVGHSGSGSKWDGSSTHHCRVYSLRTIQ
ncbi:MAG: hypothetical protein AAGB12_16130 [Pseudomonadota bacterium]